MDHSITSDAPSLPAGASDAATVRGTCVALNEEPAAVPTTFGPTQIPHPVWGKYNNAEMLFVLETHIVEL
jgi:hypothetical protein